MIENKELHYMAKIVADNYRGRKVLLWGDSPGLREILKVKYGIQIEFVVTVLKNIINGTSIQDLSVIDGKREDFYLVAWGRVQDEYYTNIIEKYGYSDKRDYVYRMHKPIELYNWDCSMKEYHDEYGNRIESST